MPAYPPYCISATNNAIGLKAWETLYDFEPTRRIISDTLVTLNGGGATYRAKVEQALTDAWVNQRHLNNVSLDEAADFVTALWGPAREGILTLNAGLRSAAQALERIKGRTDAIVGGPGSPPPGGNLAGLQSQITNDVRSIEAQLQQIVRSTTAVEDYLAKAIVAYYDRAVWIAGQEAGQALRQATAEVTAEAQRAELQLHNELVTVERWVSATAGDLLTYTEQASAVAERNAVATVNADAVAGLQPVWAGTAESVNTATQQLVAEHPEALQHVYSVSPTVPPSLAMAMEALAVAEGNMAQTLLDCVLPNCNTKNKFAKGLKALDGLLTGGALFALVADAAHDPAGTARVVEGILQPIGTATYDAAKPLIGL